MTAPDIGAGAESDLESRLARQLVAGATAISADAPMPRGARALLPALRRALWLPAARQARRSIAYERDLAGQDPASAARRFLESYGITISAEAPGRPMARLTAPLAPVAQGRPLIVAANHPAVFDTFVIDALLGRTDMVTISGDHYDESLVHSNSKLIRTGQGMASVTAFRQALAHLREGGALLLFPAADAAEPDPRLARPGRELIGPWKSGFGALARGAALARPDAVVLPIAVSGTLSLPALALARLAPDPRVTWRLLLLMQLGGVPGCGRDHAVAHVGSPIRCADLGPDGPDRVREELVRLADRSYFHWRGTPNPRPGVTAASAP